MELLSRGAQKFLQDVNKQKTIACDVQSGQTISSMRDKKLQIADIK